MRAGMRKKDGTVAPTLSIASLALLGPSRATIAGLPAPPIVGATMIAMGAR